MNKKFAIILGIILILILLRLNYQNKVSNMKITCEAWNDGENIPKKFICDGEDISPALKISEVPKEAKSLALIYEDPDTSIGTYVHWLVWNIDPTKTDIKEGELGFGVIGANSSKQNKYFGPCPPFGVHRYFFRLYALNTVLDISTESNKDNLMAAMEGHILTETELLGRYSR